MMKRVPVFLLSLWVLSAGIFLLSNPACAEVKVFFENNTAGPVKLATIPPDAEKAKLVATIKPQDVHSAQADAGSRWAIYDVSNKPLKAITLTAEPLQHYTVDAAGMELESKSSPDESLTEGAQAPLAAIAFLNNSPGDVKIATFQPGDKKSKLVKKVPPREAFRTEAPVGSRWIIFDMDNNVLNSTEVTREAEQYLMAVPPANPDKTAGTADDQSRREESARQQETSAEQAEETAFITGMYLTEGGFFLQEPDASGKLSDTWSYRHHGTPDIIQKNYME
ncbi:MAG: hypothetical protein K8I00_12355, partial [Candidatus Omnitrophica bacterium]|nr:hypothetical protein [Candidatus Omnitrophota bacterium]